jgi:hypothetical protein
LAARELTFSARWSTEDCIGLFSSWLLSTRRRHACDTIVSGVGCASWCASPLSRLLLAGALAAADWSMYLRHASWGREGAEKKELKAEMKELKAEMKELKEETSGGARGAFGRGGG